MEIKAVKFRKGGSPRIGRNMPQKTFRERLEDYALKKYGVVPEHLWPSNPGNAILRHKENERWFGLLVNILRNKLKLEGDDRVDIITLKVASVEHAAEYLQLPGFRYGYPHGHGNWITVLLDGSAKFADVKKALDESFEVTEKKGPAKRGVSNWPNKRFK